MLRFHFSIQNFPLLKSYLLVKGWCRLTPQRVTEGFYGSARLHFKCQWFSCGCEKNSRHSLKFPPDAMSAIATASSLLLMSGSTAALLQSLECCWQFLVWKAKSYIIWSFMCWVLSELWLHLRFYPIGGNQSISDLLKYKYKATNSNTYTYTNKN